MCDTVFVKHSYGSPMKKSTKLDTVHLQVTSWADVNSNSCSITVSINKLINWMLLLLFLSGNHNEILSLVGLEAINKDILQPDSSRPPSC